MQYSRLEERLLKTTFLTLYSSFIKLANPKNQYQSIRGLLKFVEYYIIICDHILEEVER